MRNKTIGYAALISAAVMLASAAPVEGQRNLQVVASLTPYRSIAEEIVGDRGTVESIAGARQDTHFVQAKPRF